MIRYEYYKHFLDVPQEIRISVLKRLGVSSGSMRCDAKFYNSECLIAFDDELPIGWVTLNRPPLTERGSNGDDVNVFVSPKYRRQGIGTSLVTNILTYHDGTVKAYPFDKKGASFYRQFEKVNIQ